MKGERCDGKIPIKWPKSFGVVLALLTLLFFAGCAEPLTDREIKQTSTERLCSLHYQEITKSEDDSDTRFFDELVKRDAFLKKKCPKRVLDSRHLGRDVALARKSQSDLEDLSTSELCDSLNAPKNYSSKRIMQELLDRDVFLSGEVSRGFNKKCHVLEYQEVIAKATSSMSPEKLKKMETKQLCIAHNFQEDRPIKNCVKTHSCRRGNYSHYALPYIEYRPTKINRELQERFSSREWKLINEDKIARGMSRGSLLCSWGQPYEINTTVTAAGKREQFIYKSGQYDYDPSYVYVENGVVTSWQQ